MIGLFLFVPAADAYQNIIPKNVLILLSVEYGLPAYDLILHEIRSKLKDSAAEPVNLYAEYLDSTRFPDERYVSKLFDLYNEKYAQVKIDLLIAVGPNLLPIIDQYGRSGLAELPILSIDLIESKAKIPDSFRRVNRTGVLFDLDIKKSFELIHSLHSDISQVYIVAGVAKLDVYLETLARAAARVYEKEFQVNYLNGMSMNDILFSVSNLPPNSVVLVMSIQSDVLGVPYYTNEACRLISTRSNAPVYVLFESNMDVGGVGGFLIQFKEGGIRAGEIALRILRGEPPGKIVPVRGGLSQYMFDWRQLKRWEIPEYRLPEGSVFTHREISFFQKYKWQVIAILLFAALQSILIGLLIVLNRKQRNLSSNLISAQRRYRDLLRIERSSRLGELSASLAHELNQPLAAILSNSQAALRFLRSKPLNLERLREILDNIVDDDKRAAGIIRGMRAMLKQEQTAKAPVLFNDILDDVLAIFRGEAHARRIHIETAYDSALPAILADKSQMQQVIMNLIMNAAEAVSQNSSENKKIIVSTRKQGNNVHVAVRDFGPGIDIMKIDEVFDPFFTTKIGGMGMGLALCRTIIQEHDGYIHIENNADLGATATIELPAIQND